MAKDLLGGIEFQRYQRWIERMVGRGCAIRVFDATGRALCGSASPADGELARRLLQVPQQDGAGVQRVELDSGQSLLYRPLQVSGAGLAGWAALVADARASSDAPLSIEHMAEALEDVGAAIAGEALANSELDKMAEELGECYEELHLVFTMSAYDYPRAWEDQDAMRALLQSIVEHMGADVAAFVRPADGLCVHAPSASAEIHDLELLLAVMRGSLFRFVQSAGETVVLNAPDDPRRAHTFGGIPYRVLACPVQVGHGIDSIVVLLNRTHKRPFTNGDRRLLEVQANQLASVGKMIATLRKNEAIQATFGKYVDPRIVRNLIEDGNFAAVGERRSMSVLFSDLEGFTGLCEQLTPDAAVKFLNGYFNLVSRPIVAKQGIIDKYMGDAVMAFWGPPFTDPDEHARLACEAAFEQLACLNEYRRIVPSIIGERKGLPRVNMRSGISTGEVTIGNVGSERLKGYTVIGDTVNLAARLETACKQYGVHILISEETRARAGAAIETRELDRIRVVGRSQPVNVYELIGLAGGITTSSRELRDAFEAALVRYRLGDISDASLIWEDCARMAPDDQPTRMFLGRCQVLGEQSIPDPWDGVWTLDVK
jgi:class 3 adenylate cyclase